MRQDINRGRGSRSERPTLYRFGIEQLRRRACMKALIAIAVAIAPIPSNTVEGQTMVITRGGSKTAQPGSSETFTGAVRVTPLFDANDAMHASCASVSFEATVRSAWHSHPKGSFSS
jgi:hypothetical protein